MPPSLPLLLLHLRSRRVLLLALAFTALPLALMWQDFQLDRDFGALYRFLGRARSHAIAEAAPVAVRFSYSFAVAETLDGHTLERLFLPTLSAVRYDTKLGAGRVVFGAGTGDTNPYNIHLHGGDIALRSWLGRERSVWVHCTGGITEGRNGDWTRNSR